ncbi:MAG: phenylacetate--CoA ligase family protein [Dehalococcoidia bacterium]|nr:MAG: phenylacetate--CoA ligase family protein [Dehalococcoidia bacterium]
METIFLEQWLHNIIRQKVKEDPEYRQFVGKESIDQLTRADIDLYHLFKLRKIVSYAYQKSTFYRELFNRSGIKIDDIRSLDDIANIPLTNPIDIAQHPYQFACVSLGDIARITTFISSGTTGPRKRVFCTGGDLEVMTDFMAAGMRTVATEGDVVQIMLPSARPNDQADLLANGVRKMGGLPVISGTSLSPEQQLTIIGQAHPTILFASVSRMYRITQETRHNHDLKGKGVKVVFVTSEYLSDSMRRQLQDAWNCDVHVHYGLTEMGLGVAVECHAHNGFHFNEADLLVEVVDPQTGAVLANDEEGELVFTTLTREAMPLIRYRTHDISKLISSPCECGAATLKKIAKVTRRLEGIARIGEGDEIYPAMFDELIFSIPEVIDYQLTLGKEGGKDILLFRAEVTKESQHICEAIGKVVLSHSLFRKSVEAKRVALPKVELVSRGTLRRLTRAKKLIIDERRGKC